jgi:hypothetical protein
MNPSLLDTTLPVAPPPFLVALVRKARDIPPSEREIEIRLGKTGPNAFAPGVSKDTFDALERDFLSLSLSTTDRWEEVVDFFHAHRREGKVRTRVRYDTTDMRIWPEHVAKRTAVSITVARHDDPEEGARIAAARERPVHDVEPACLPTHVRIKQRRTFSDVRDGRVTWVYELSKTWSGRTRNAAEYEQVHGEPVYEVECELVDEGGDYLSRTDDSTAALSLLMKASILLGDDPATPLLVER